MLLDVGPSMQPYLPLMRRMLFALFSTKVPPQSITCLGAKGNQSIVHGSSPRPVPRHARACALHAHMELKYHATGGTSLATVRHTAKMH